MKNKLITITGGDLCGKETQTKLLVEVLRRSGIKTERMEFPRYDRPFGKLMGAMLDGKSFSIDGYWNRDLSQDDMSYYRHAGINPLRGGKGWIGELPKKGSSILYQSICIADKVDAQEDIRAALKRGWLICDRYDPELLVYGIVDAPEHRQWVEESYKLLEHKSDIVVVLMNRTGQYSRPGEEKDANEKDLSFQHRIYDTYEYLAEEYGWHIIEVDKIADGSGDLTESVWNVADAIVEKINSYGHDFKWKSDDIDLCRQILEVKLFNEPGVIAPRKG